MRRIIKTSVGLVMVLVMMAAIASSMASASSSSSIEISGHIVSSSQYRVVYDANGGARSNGEGVFAGSYVHAGGTDTVHAVSEIGFMRYGYTFVIWNTKRDGSGRPYAPGSKVTLYRNMTLYAQWAKDKETPDSQGNTGGGSFIGTPPGFVIPWNVGTSASTSTAAPHIEAVELGSGTTEEMIEEAEHPRIGAAPPDRATVGNDASAGMAVQQDALHVENTWNTGIGMILSSFKTGDPACAPLWVWVSLLIVKLATTAYLLWIVRREKHHKTQEL